MELKEQLQNAIIKAVQKAYGVTIETVDFQETRKEFEGDITAVVFSLLRFVKGNPVEIGTKIGDYLVENEDLVNKYNVVKGFLNISIDHSYHLEQFYHALEDDNFGPY